MAEQYSIESVFHIFFTHLPIDGHYFVYTYPYLNCMNIVVQISLEIVTTGLEILKYKISYTEGGCKGTILSLNSPFPYFWDPYWTFFMFCAWSLPHCLQGYETTGSGDLTSPFQHWLNESYIHIVPVLYLPIWGKGAFLQHHVICVSVPRKGISCLSFFLFIYLINIY